MNVARFIDHSFRKVNITENNDCDWSISKQLLEKNNRDWLIRKVWQGYFVMTSRNFQMIENQVEN